MNDWNKLDGVIFQQIRKYDAVIFKQPIRYRVLK